tara:strand:- start:5243 stop:6925 length:1683 start_codon:yes stop_codon:yes gene_type:complete
MELKFKEHPILKPPSDDEIVWLAKNDPKLLKDLWESHQGRIAASVEDPLRFGFDLESWKRIRWAMGEYSEVLALGGNRSGKTTGFAKLVMEAVTESDNGHVVCFSQNSDTSIKVQQAAIWEMMPREFKKKIKSTTGFINHSMQNGFTGSGFIFPDTKTRVDFKTYTQYSNNSTILEGFKFGFPDPKGLNIGAWLDEYLGDASLVDTLRYRLADYDAIMGLGFTPIDGYTPFVAEYLKGAETLETKPAQLLDGRQVPVKQKAETREAGIIYLHSDENPFGGYARIAKDLKGRPEDEIKVRAYGLPVKSMAGLLPLFNISVNVLGDTYNEYGMKFPDISNRQRYTCYQVLDPAGARNYAAIWGAVSASGDVYIRREWPDAPTYGEWALYGNSTRINSVHARWREGPASRKEGYDVEGYANLFKEIEKELGIDVFERIGDSRYFATENDNNDDLFTLFEDHGMSFIPSDGRTEEIGTTALDEWFHYNPNEKIDVANRPRCFIHESCGNLVDSLVNYNANGKADEALKDFFDLMRYFRMHNGGDGPDHVVPNRMLTTKIGKGGY